jgi:hypothetical protein
MSEDAHETEYFPAVERADLKRQVAKNRAQAVKAWRQAMRCHALMWRRQRRTRAGGLALHSALLCWKHAAEILAGRGRA